jgi:hypothetical protein
MTRSLLIQVPDYPFARAASQPLVSAALNKLKIENFQFPVAIRPQKPPGADFECA